MLIESLFKMKQKNPISDIEPKKLLFKSHNNLAKTNELETKENIQGKRKQ